MTDRKIINICGSRGLGDLIATISFIITHHKKEIYRDCKFHYIFNYPPGFDYPTSVDTLMKEYLPPSGLDITYETTSDFYSVRPSECNEKFGKENEFKTWFFSASRNIKYEPIVSMWEKNTQGPVGLNINCSNNNDQYPFREKFFPDYIDDQLRALIDEKNYVLLGRPFSVEETIKKMAKCRYIVGIDNAWAHMSKPMQIPYYLIRNGLRPEMARGLHSASKNVKILETHELNRVISRSLVKVNPTHTFKLSMSDRNKALFDKPEVWVGY